MTWPLAERRRRRSEDRQLALRYQLESAQNRGGLEAVALADADGLILASAGEAGVCEELGAFAPLVAKSALGMRLPPMLRGGDVAVRSIPAYGQNLYLACVGGGVARDAVMGHSVSGVARILTTN